MVTSKDVIGKDKQMEIDKVMTKNPLVVQERTSLAYVAHMMVWEGIEVVPVVNQSNELKGVVSRQDVLKALNQMQRQPQVGETLEDVVTRSLVTKDGDPTAFQIEVTPQMTNELGTLSNGVLTSLIIESSSRLLLHLKKGKMVVESLNIYFIEPVQIDSKITIKPELMDAGRVYAKIIINIYLERKLVGKCMLMAQLMDR